MSEAPLHEFQIKFPGSQEYIPAVRKYVSEALLANNCDPKFTYRSEIIVDEVCNNAVSFGCVSMDAAVELRCQVHPDRVEFVVKDEGGTNENVKRLTDAVKRRVRAPAARESGKRESLGLEIVRMLSDDVTFEVDADNLTTVRVVKQREEDSGDEAGGAEAT
jgi:anti-sigma regulatory factor (Ser/Thr protein kinase)